MKTLLLCPSFPYTFWSFRESCKLMSAKALATPLGLITVAALLPRDWELRLVDMNARALTPDDWEWADIVMISAMYTQRDGALDLIKEAKRRGIPSVVGGPYPTSVPHESLEAGADFLVKGEAEDIMDEFLEAVRSGQRGGVFESPERPDMTTSPIPRFDLLDLSDYASVSIQTSRGCPFDCEFCDIIHLYGRKPRYKTPDQVLAELDEIDRLGWRHEVFISDDNFIGNRAHARAILERLIPWSKGRGEPFSFWTQASVNLGRDVGMIDLMTEANFSTVFVGIESPDVNVLTRNRKYQNASHPLVESINTITRNGLSVLGSFILGFDGEEPGAGERICALVEETAIPVAMLNTLQVAPNTSLWDRLKEEGRLIEELTCGQTTGAQLNYLPTRPEAEIQREFADAWAYLYDHARFLDRTHRYYRMMRPTRSAIAKKNGPREKNSSSNPKAKKSKEQLLVELKSLLRVLWMEGVRSGDRIRFWRHFGDILKRNPSRCRKYLAMIGVAWNMIEMTEEIQRRARETSTRSSDTPGRSSDSGPTVLSEAEREGIGAGL